jgi:hypothetical protein
MQLSPVIFWDTDMAKIDWDKNFRYVIVKVVMYGTLEDWQQMVNYYGLEKIKQAVISERELDARSLSFLSCILEIPKEDFVCCTQKLLHQLPWSS